MMYGLDIGGTKIELAIYDDNLKLKSSWREPTPKQEYQQFLTTISGMVNEADRKIGSRGTVGIGLPVYIDSHGCVVSANIPCISGKPLLKDLPEQLGRTVYFEHDVKTLVFSEANGGAADGAKRALGVVLGTGVSGGLYLDGALYHGRQKIAGEYGHILLPGILQQRYNFPLRQCGCGALGCVEQYLAGPGLLWLCSHFGGHYASTSELVKAMRENDAKALEIFAAYIDCLGCFFAQLTLMFDPDVIVLGGGLSNVSEIYEQLPAEMSDYLFEGVTPPKVVPPRFGDSSGVRGAALLGREAMNAMELDHD